MEGFDAKIISLYARGLTVREIQGHLKEIYGTEVSPDLISRVTDAVLEEVREWQSRPLATAALLAYILVAKFDDHLPLYRLNEIFARMGADIPDSTLVDWCGRTMKLLLPLIERIEGHVRGHDLLHADDTPIRALDRSLCTAGVSGQLGKGVRKGRIWAYVLDQRPWAGPAPPGVAYKFATDWKAEHVIAHLRDARGILQADAYKGYAKLYAPAADGTAQFREAACWAHLRRDFHDLWVGAKSPIAREALDRIGAIYGIEAQISGKKRSGLVRRASGSEQAQGRGIPRLGPGPATKLPAKGDLANAFRYALARWPAFCLFLEDGRVAIDNNPAERALKPIGTGRKNWLFAGADTGAETLARAMTIIETAKMNGLDPQAYLTDVLTRIFMLDYVADILGEHPDLINAIVSNDDNLSYGSIITVSDGPDEFQTAITRDAIDELRDLLPDLRRSPAEWNDFLHSGIDDPQTVESVKVHKLR